MDMLTGVMNRNEMNNLVDEMTRESENVVKNVGVIFADLNGLKFVNDDYGHESGDTLLKDAAKVLSQVFPKDCIFRAGGDEFTVIIKGITREDLDQKISILRKNAEDYPHLSFAIGSHVEEDGRKIKQALKAADQNMYADKRKFYDEHPNRTRRLER